MWWKEIVIVHLSLLQIIISSQPVIFNRYAYDPTSSKYDQCYICPRAVDGYESGIRDLDGEQTQISSPLSMPVDDCPCKFTGRDSEGSSSIFYPSLVGGARSMQRAQDLKKESRPLLQPEVGLASSVLETIKEATDEEYQDALARDVSRIAMKAAEPSLLDTVPEATKNLVTIVISPRSTKKDDDAIPESSRFHETRCIKSPLKSQRTWNRKDYSVPRLMKPYFLPKTKSIMHKSLFDMDNSPSNIQENFETKTNNNLNSKLKMNLVMLNGFPNEIEPTESNLDTFSNAGSALKNIFEDQCDDFKNNDASKIYTLANLKSKLRDLAVLRNEKNQKNNQLSGLAQRKIKIFENKPYDAAMKSLYPQLPSLSSVYDKQSPLVKNLLKLRDVELIPPRKTYFDETRQKNKDFDLKSAGTENKGKLLTLNENTENSDECYTISSDFTDKQKSDDFDHFESASIEGNMSPISTVQSIVQAENKDTLSNDSTLHDDCGDNPENKHTSEEINTTNNDIITSDSKDKNIEFDSEKSEESEDMSDSEVDSNNIIQKLFLQQEEGSQNSSIDAEDQDKDKNTCDMQRPPTIFEADLSQITNIEKESSIPSTTLSQINNNKLHQQPLESIQKTVRPKLDKTLTLNTESSQLVTTPFKISFERKQDEDLSTKDLQNFSNSLLIQENVLKSIETILHKEKNNIKPGDILKTIKKLQIPKDKENNNMSSELSRADAVDSNENDPEEYEYYSNDDENFSTNREIQPDNSTISSSKNIYTSLNNEKSDLEEGNISNSEMSAQPSHVNYDLLRPHLGSSMTQDITDQSSFPTQENDQVKPLAMTSLEEIKKGITKIIDAGQQEEEALGPICSDPLNESSNTNSILSSDIYRPRPFENVQSSLRSRLNLKSYKTDAALPAVARVQPFNLESIFNDRAGMPSTSLLLNRDKAKHLLESKPVFNGLGSFMGERENIKNIFKSNTQNIFKDATMPFSDKPITKIHDNLKETLVGKYGVLNRSNGAKSDIYDSILKNRENMKVKLQALHKTLNDKYKNKITFDTTNKPQSRNIHPSLQDKKNDLQINDLRKKTNPKTVFPERLADKEPPLFSNSLLPQLNQKTLRKNNMLSKDAKNLYSIDGNNHINQNLKISQLLSDISKLNNQRNTKLKDKDITSFRNGNVKVSFSTTTASPIIINNRFQTQPYDRLLPSGKIQKSSSDPANSKLRGNLYKTILENARDSKNLPSKLVPVKSNSKSDISQRKPEVSTFKPAITTSGMESLLRQNPSLILPASSLRKENPTTTNLREALRSKLASIKSNEKTIQNNKNNDIPIIDAVESPSDNIKAIINPLKENTAYKCTMMCVKDK